MGLAIGIASGVWVTLYEYEGWTFVLRQGPNVLTICTVTYARTWFNDQPKVSF
jgi:hypothetical protein